MNFHILFFSLFSFLTLVLINFTLRNKKILIDDYKSSTHKISKKQNVTVSGGIFFAICISLIIFYFNLPNLFFYLLTIFIIGLLSDLKILNSPKFRLIVQFIFIFFFVILFNLNISETRIDIIDNFLHNNIFSVIFTICCFLVLINGANFIDGLNGLFSGYFILIIINLLILLSTEKITLDRELINFFYILIPLIIFFVFNILGVNFSGDAGAYLIATIIGYLSIEISSFNKNDLSPIFIVILFWYPVFENLFSFIRRTISKNSQVNADKVHLHHLIYYSLLKKIKFKNKILCNSVSSVVILSYNFLIFLIAINYINNSIILSSIIIINIFVYNYVYLKLLVKLNLVKNN